MPAPNRPAPAPGSGPPVSLGSVLIVLGPLLLATFAVLFFPMLNPDIVHFANDGPYGTLLARPYQMPDSFRGIWNDLLWLGAWNGNFYPNITGTSIGLLGPSLYHKGMISIGLIFLGLSAGVCLHAFRFPRWVCVLGGLAAALNMNVFSNACWGLPSRSHAMGAAFLAVAALHDASGRFRVIKAVLAGLALGLGITEAGDNGAIFAIVVGFYGIFRSVTRPEPQPRLARVAWGIGRVAIAAVVAGIFAAQTLNIFVNLAVKGVVGVSDDRFTPEQKWDFATQGSLHPKETLRVIIPGLYGYRMDAEDGGNYWGRVGESLAAPGHSRHSGAGEHAGVIVVLVALWAVYRSRRAPGDGGFSDDERRCIWFWAGAAAICLLLAWGKWGPLYQLLYALPYFNTIRLPLKWMHPFHLCLIILFAHGLTGLGRLYLTKRETRSSGGGNRPPGATPKLPTTDRRWLWFCLGAVGVAIIGALLYTASEKSLAQALGQAEVLGDPVRMAAFSVREVYWFVAFLVMSVGVMLAIMSGRFAARSVVGPAIVIGLLFSADLIRGNSHWMLFFNHRERYALNPPLEFLRSQSANFRVAKVPDGPFFYDLQMQAQARRNDPAALQQLQQAAGLFQHVQGYTHEQWQQNQFPYYNIPCLDMSQEPRLPGDKLAFRSAMTNAMAQGRATREYEMTSTRFFVGLAGQAELLNRYYDPAQRRFHDGMRFRLDPTRPGSPFFGDLRVHADTNGPFALVQFDGALPRARLFQKWEVITNESAMLARLGTADFNPAETLLVHDAIPLPASVPVTNTAPESSGANEALIQPIETSHRVDIRVQASRASILLLTDRFDPAWHVTVDGQTAILLRCNYLMRGVQIPPGAHVVKFEYRPSTVGVWLMAACDMVGVLLLIRLAIAKRA